MLHIYYLKTKTDVKQFTLDNTPEEQKEDEEKAPKNTTDSDNIKSDVEKEKTKDSTDEFNEVHKNCPKGRKTTEWCSHKQCEYKKFQCK